jgi:hypothetical protein
MPHNDPYIIRHEATISTAITFIQLKAGTAYGFEILGVTVTQRGSTTSTSESIALVRKTAGATVTTGAIGTHVFLTDPNMANPNLALGTTSTGVIATAEGTDGDIIQKLGYNILNGYYYLPIPEGRIYVPVSGIIGLKFLTAPASQLWQAEIVIRES